jgi:hypothetical protein
MTGNSLPHNDKQAIYYYFSYLSFKRQITSFNNLFSRLIKLIAMLVTGAIFAKEKGCF